ncbi:MAG: hypothetical protein NVSMB55_21310 [Mycobacteriales bacterium]
MKIELDMTEADFERLTEVASPDWPIDPRAACDAAPAGQTAGLGRRWEFAYWVGVNWANVMLARAFVLAKGHECEVVWDASDASAISWRLLTSYGGRVTPPLAVGVR